MQSKEDAETIFEFVLQTISKFNLSRKVLAVATDNASAMVSFMNKLNDFMLDKYKIEIYHIRCAAHILNLIVSVLYNSLEMKESIFAVRNVVKAVRGSSKLEHKLQQYAHFHDEPDKKLILDCEIRWNSTFDMLQVALKLKMSLTDLAANESSLQIISDDDWNKVKVVVSLLQPFKLATEEICGDNFVLVSSLYPVFISIKDHLNECGKKNTYSIYKSIIDNMLD